MRTLLLGLALVGVVLFAVGCGDKEKTVEIIDTSTPSDYKVKLSGEPLGDGIRVVWSWFFIGTTSGDVVCKLDAQDGQERNFVGAGTYEGIYSTCGQRTASISCEDETGEQASSTASADPCVGQEASGRKKHGAKTRAPRLVLRR